MKNSISFSVIAVSFLLCALANISRAQGAQGDTSITYDDTTGIVTAYGETTSDLDTDYANQVSFSVKDQNGVTVATANDYQLYDTAAASAQFTATPGSVYTVTTNHCLRLQSWDYDNVFPYQQFYYDDWDMSSFLGQNIYSPLDYWFASPGWQEIHRPSNVVCIGKTYDTVEVRPTVKITSTNVSGFIQGTTQKAMLGATIPLSATVNPTGGSYQWKLDSTSVGSNSASLNQTISTLGSHAISVTYTKSNSSATATVTINVVAPEVDTSTDQHVEMTGAQGETDVLSGTGCMTSGIDINWYLTGGCTAGSEDQAGMVIQVFVKDPGAIISNASESKVKLVQIVNTYNKRFTPTACETLTLRTAQNNTSTGWLLDSSDPYPISTAVGAITPSSGPNVKLNDTPNAKLATPYDYTLDDKFETYLVYFTGTNESPQNQKAIAVLAWSYGGTTTHSGFTYSGSTGTLFPSSDTVIFGTKLTPSNDGTGIRGLDSTTTTAQDFFNAQNWQSCP